MLPQVADVKADDGRAALFDLLGLVHKEPPEIEQKMLEKKALFP